MATATEWIRGARPHTLPNAVAPVLAGSGAAALLDAFSWWRTALAMLVALALVIGVNFANDYSDGIRGADSQRVGPTRLVGSGAAWPRMVLLAAGVALALAAVFGFVLVAATGHWWLLIVGAGSLAGAWFYTGGKHPYGYAGFGELAVFLFFGPIAVLGTMFVQAGEISWPGIGGAIAVGSFSTAVLVANNLRDIPTDQLANKRTLAVHLGDSGSRRLYLVLIAVPFAVTVLLATHLPTTLFALVAVLPLIVPARMVILGETGARLIPVLRDTGLAMIIWSTLVFLAQVFA